MKRKESLSLSRTISEISSIDECPMIADALEHGAPEPYRTGDKCDGYGFIELCTGCKKCKLNTYYGEYH